MGLIFQVEANTFRGESAFDALSFENNNKDTISGLTTIAISTRVQSFANVSNFLFLVHFYFTV
ncbi:MAG: hypothetical protein ACJAX3_000704 [Patiriisocius sp.]